MVELPKGFRVDILFPDEYEDMIAEVYFGETFLCLLSQDRGYSSLDIEIPLGDGSALLKLALSDLEAAVSYAKRRLYDLRADTSQSEEAP